MPLAEHGDESAQVLSLPTITGWPVDTGEVCRQVEHHAHTELDQVGLAEHFVFADGLRQCGRKNLLFVVAKKVAAENPQLDQAGRAVCGAVQYQQHIGHDDRALVVPGLHQLRFFQRFHGLAVTGNRERARRPASVIQ